MTLCSKPAMKALRSVGKALADGSAWQKLATPTAGQGKTAWPKGNAELERVGVRFDYDGEVTLDGTVFHKFQCQPNAGKIPASLKEWRDKNGGTHAVITTVFIKKDGSKPEVLEAVEKAMEEIKAS